MVIFFIYSERVLDQFGTALFFMGILKSFLVFSNCDDSLL